MSRLELHIKKSKDKEVWKKQAKAKGHKSLSAYVEYLIERDIG